MSGMREFRWVRHRCVAALFLLCFAGTSACVAQQVYKWTDAAGTVHYSEQPPPDGVKNQQMQLSGSTESSDGTAQPEIADADPSTLDKANDAQEAHMCSVARQNLKLLESDAMVTGGGDIHTATQLVGEDREKARDEARKQIARYCHDQ